RIDCLGTNAVDERRIEEAVREHFALTPRSIIESLDLRKPIYTPTACHGHFGRQPYEQDGLRFFPWERLDKAAALRSACS
ncbi:MAG: methionine adenosyltransferase, partial [Planctomycetota bacterium]